MAYYLLFAPTQIEQGVRVAFPRNFMEHLLSVLFCRYPGTTFLDHVLRFHAEEDVKMIVMLGEVSVLFWRGRSCGTVQDVCVLMFALEQSSWL